MIPRDTLLALRHTRINPTFLKFFQQNFCETYSISFSLLIIFFIYLILFSNRHTRPMFVLLDCKAIFAQQRY